MTDNIDPALAAPLALLGALYVIYKTYIEPGYKKDRKQ